MKYLVFLSLLFFGNLISAQDKLLFAESKEAQTKLNEEFSNPETSILEVDDFKNFKGLEFYPIDLKYRVEAKFIRTPNEKPFLMPTTTDRKPEYVKYGEAHFNIDGKDLKLNLYKNTQPYDEPGYEDYLFLPFTDYTSGDGSYGGGRFLDVRIPEGDKIIIDFNKAYNPYCAYNHKYSCPIPPKENDLKARIEAGVKVFISHSLIYANTNPPTDLLPKLIKFEISNIEVSNLDSGYIGNTRFKRNNCETGGYSFFSPFYERPELLRSKVNSTKYKGGVNISISDNTSKYEFDIRNIEISNDSSTAEIDVLKDGVIFKSKLHGENLSEEYILNEFSKFKNSLLLYEEDCTPCVVVGILATVALSEKASGCTTPCDGILTVDACSCSCIPNP